MKTASYTLLYPDEPGLARIALCDTFRAAAQAKKDGCHMAIVHNRLTETYGWTLEVASVLGRVHPHLAKPLLFAAKFMLFPALMSAFECNIQTVVNRVRKTQFRIHVDQLEGDFQGAASTAPGMTVYHQLPVWSGFLQKAIQVAGKEWRDLHTISQVEAAGLPSFRVGPRRFALFFPYEGATIAHSAPPPEEVKAPRPLFACRGW